MSYQFTCDKCNGISCEYGNVETMKKAYTTHLSVCNASFFEHVIDFHKKFDLLALPEPGFLEPDVTEFRIGFMQEELNEFAVAIECSDLEMAADALVDLTYVVLGTAYLMGIPFKDCWDEVHKANMKKVRAPSAEHSKRNHQCDVIKPENWVPPDLSKFLKGK